MAITTSLQPRHLYLKPLYALACLAFAVWGYYDYAVKIPAQEAAVAEHAALQGTKDAIEKKRERGETPSAEDIAAYDAALTTLAEKYPSAPAPPNSYDRPVQLWVYVVGCGVLGVPMFLWPLWTMSRKRYTLEDDGTLRFPEGTYRPEDVKDIDMSRWMSKSIATVEFADGKRAELDDYKYRNLHRIVGAIAHRLHPDEWTAEAKSTKSKPKSAAHE